MTDLRDRAVALYDAFTHGHGDRRTLLKQMTALAGSVAAAEALVGGIAASPAAAALTEATDPRLIAEDIKGQAAGKPSAAYAVRPKATRTPHPTVFVIHENRGLTPHIRDVARRVALAGFYVFAPDLLAPQGGTPADEDRARTLIGTIDYDLALAQVEAMAGEIDGGRVGLVGFCWGGAFANRMAVVGGIDAAVSYYGPAPAPAEAPRVQCPLMIHLAGKDARVAETATPWIAALKKAGKPVDAFTYAGVDHAFNNDTSPERYDKPAADLAWGRTIAFLHKQLDARPL